MRKKIWKNARPRSINHAMELCVNYARTEKNLSVEHIAERLALANHSVLYKWLSNGRMPSIYILPFEAACGVNYITQYLAASGDHMLVKIPKGKAAKDDDLFAMNTHFQQALNLLVKFYKSEEDVEPTLAAIEKSMADMAGHRANVSKARMPELEFDSDD